MQLLSQSGRERSHPTLELWERLKLVLSIQLAWATLSMLWNVVGVGRIAQGLRPPGPTASILAAAILLAIGFWLVIGLRRWPILYVVLSVLGGLMALAAVVNAFTSDPTLWPSEFWRYAGALLNGVGALGALLAVVGVVRWKMSQTRQ